MNTLDFPKVAVLLAIYNGKPFINKQLDSILNQIKVNVQVFISIDLSADDSYDYCKTLDREHINLTILGYGKRFGGAAKNFFRLIRDVDFSGYDYIAFSDQDDIWFSDKLIHGIGQMGKHHAEAYSANVIAFWEDGREKLIDKAQPQREFDYLFEAAGPGCTYIFTNKAASLIKYYLNQFPELDNFILHDWLSYAILRHNQYKWFIDSVPKMKYRQHDNNQIGANTSFRGKLHRIQTILSGQAFDYVAMLINVLKIYDLNVSSRIGVLKLAVKANQLRRRKIDQIFAFIALLIYAIKGPDK
ncbi:glycosyltransferase [methane-oxidizing endosymbiont of Gigantopelta aegis]|uniref:glycosyltransferase n=1 Tax=methane-oxidizing endosymbiont of Gigantopelta aegis TaxID=2794938 RepID=UPI0018DD4971|nr:glycosyltransferase [methane-oxidizing endosymbiont of Gigantopelta aegis]